MVPFFLSHHDTNTIYARVQTIAGKVPMVVIHGRLWATTARFVKRRDLKIMGKEPLKIRPL
jgi:hypothetical protein